MRLLVCGDRNWWDALTIRTELFSRMPSVVIEGEARGADTIAREEAESLGIPVEKYPADWEKHGRAAGPIRNKQMIDEGKPDFVLAFHDDYENSRGTRNMVSQAQDRGIPTTVWHHGRIL